MTKILTATTRKKLMLTAALLGSAMLPQGGWADIAASNDFVSTLGSAADGTTTEEVTANVSLFKSKLSEATTQLSTARSNLAAMSPGSAAYLTQASKVEQLNAVSTALQTIIDKLGSGYAISDYSVTSDVADLSTKVTIIFSKIGHEASTSTLTVTLPSSDGDSTTAAATSAAATASDPLTSMLQQLASQLGGGSQNPLSSVQSMLNNIVNPTPLTNPGSNDPANAFACTPEGEVKPGNGTAVFDEAAGKVYLPDGTVLNANSGLGSMMNDATYANVKMQGPTPPGTYNLSYRESLFHGVQALRLTPTAGTTTYGRDGFLVHSPLRANSVGSNGCVAIPDYNTFLNAFKAGQVTRLVVVSGKPGSGTTSVCKPPEYNTSAPTSTGTKK
jgi:hypothetical protein